MKQLMMKNCKVSNKCTRQSLIAGFLQDRAGVTAIEFAFVLPIFLLLTFAFIEFGYYFVQKEIVDRGVSRISKAAQDRPGDDGEQGSLNLIANDIGMGIMNMRALPNYVCARSYATRDEAIAATTDPNVACEDNIIITAPPPGVVRSYYVAIRAKARETLVSLPFSDYMPDIVADSLILVTPYAIPPGAVVAFDNCPNGSTIENCPCPEGWTHFQPATGRSIVGLGQYQAGAAQITAFQRGGTEKHSMSVAEIPSHTHGLTIPMSNSGQGGENSNGGDIEVDNNGTGNVYILNAGVGVAMNIMDPYVALQYCRKNDLPAAGAAYEYSFF